jgi:hypothetical protein
VVAVLSLDGVGCILDAQNRPLDLVVVHVRSPFVSYTRILLWNRLSFATDIALVAGDRHPLILRSASISGITLSLE